jgi:hypothetical protein
LVGGRVEASGTPDQLLATSPAYRLLFGATADSS